MSVKKTLVIGLGNPYLGDDGVGVVTATRLEEVLENRIGDEISITEASVGGVRLMETMIGFDRAILIDALKVQNPAPGRIHRWTLRDLGELAPTQHTASAHDTNLPTALMAGRRLGYRLPNEVMIFAVEVCNVDEFTERMHPEVEAAIPELLRMVLAEIELEPAPRAGFVSI